MLAAADGAVYFHRRINLFNGKPTLQWPIIVFYITVGKDEGTY